MSKDRGEQNDSDEEWKKAKKEGRLPTKEDLDDTPSSEDSSGDD